MLVAQLYNLYWCGVAVEEYTRATGRTFDQVIKSRPDVAFKSPIADHCHYDMGHVCAHRDWVFMLPGEHAVRALKRGYEEFLACKTFLSQGKVKIAESIMRSFGLGKELPMAATRRSEGARATRMASEGSFFLGMKVKKAWLKSSGRG